MDLLRPLKNVNFLLQIKYGTFNPNKDGVKPNSFRFESISKMLRSENLITLRSFLNAINYYAKFVSNMEDICGPIH